MAAVGYVADSADADLLNLAGAVQAKVDNAILSGAFQIDAAFGKASYDTPLDSTNLDAEPKLRFDAFLEDVNKALAAGILTRGAAGRKGTPENVRLNMERAEDWLSRIGNGEVNIDDLTISKAEAFRAVGDPKTDAVWPDTNELYDVDSVMWGL